MGLRLTLLVLSKGQLPLTTNGGQEKVSHKPLGERSVPPTPALSGGPLDLRRNMQQLCFHQQV